MPENMIIDEATGEEHGQPLTQPGENRSKNNLLNRPTLSTSCAEVENLAVSPKAWIVSPRTGSLGSVAISGFKATDPQFPRTYYDEFIFFFQYLELKQP